MEIIQLLLVMQLFGNLNVRLVFGFFNPKPRFRFTHKFSLHITNKCDKTFNTSFEARHKQKFVGHKQHSKASIMISACQAKNMTLLCFATNNLIACYKILLTSELYF